MDENNTNRLPPLQLEPQLFCVACCKQQKQPQVLGKVHGETTSHLSQVSFYIFCSEERAHIDKYIKIKM